MQTVELKNERLLKALSGQPVDATPIWIMRQAGRYLPEYRTIRKKAGDFMDLCRTPELACEVTLQPLRRYPLDAAILFSDILTIPDAMGLGLYFTPGEGPRFQRIINTRADIEQLPIPDPNEELNYVMQAVKLIARELNGQVPLIGFAGSPWTLATYMVEGGGSKDFRKIKKLLFSQPKVLHQLLDKLAQAVIYYLNAQIDAGVQLVQIFDTWGGALGPQTYREFSLAYMEQIIAGLTRNRLWGQVPCIVFTKQSGLWLEAIAQSGCDAIGLDWAISIADAKRRVGQQVALQGNMDPAVLYASPNRIRQEVGDILSQFGPGPGHVFNLGHGIPMDVPPDNVSVLVEAVHQLSKPYHQTKE